MEGTYLIHQHHSLKHSPKVEGSALLPYTLSVDSAVFVFTFYLHENNWVRLVKCADKLERYDFEVSWKLYLSNEVQQSIMLYVYGNDMNTSAIYANHVENIVELFRIFLCIKSITQ